MKMMRVKLVLPLWVALPRLLGLDGELAPPSVHVHLVVVHVDNLHQVASHGRVCSVGSDHEVKLNIDQRPGAILGSHNLEGGFAVAEVCRHKLMIEVEGDIWPCFEGVKETPVKVSPVNGIDRLSMVSVFINKTDLHTDTASAQTKTTCMCQYTHTHTHTLTHSLNHSLTHSLTHIDTHTPSHGHHIAGSPP